MGIFDLFQKDAEDYKFRAVHKFLKRNLNGALKDYSKAIDLDPNNADSYYQRAIIYMALANKYLSDNIMKENPDDRFNYEYSELSAQDMRTAANMGHEEAIKSLKNRK